LVSFKVANAFFKLYTGPDQIELSPVLPSAQLIFAHKPFSLYGFIMRISSLVLTG